MIAIVGCGTLGSRLAPLLSNYPLLLVDHDIVRDHNVGIQNFTENDIGDTKASNLSTRIPGAISHSVFLDHLNLDLLNEASIVCDCTDNLLTRKLLSRYCVDNGIPLVHGAAAKDRGVVGVFTNKPCLECVYHNKVSVDDCRSTDINLDLAERIASRQAELTKSLLSGDSGSFISLLTPSNEHQLEISRGSCPSCTGESRPVENDFFMTFCNQTKCLSAKPLKKGVFKPGKFSFDNILAQLNPDGEIRFYGSEDIDELEKIAKKIYREN